MPAPPVCSPPIGSPAAVCLRRFTIHFRRPPTLRGKNNYLYRGEYGFDWLREEYIYPVETVLVNHTWASPPTLVNAAQALCRDPATLRTEYQRDVKNPITPHGQDYYPAWLSIFAHGVAGNANSTMHQRGVWLTLQLDEIDEIVNDGTEIIFRPGKACLKVTPAKIPISSFLATTKKSRTLGAGGATVNYYELVNGIHVKCQGDTLGAHEEIKVFAKLGGTEIEVGKLMVYKNSIVPKASIVVINVITRNAAGNKVYPGPHDSFEYLYKFQSFNQAMVRAEVRAGENFDLVKLAQDPANIDVISFLNDINNPAYMNTNNAGSNIRNQLCAMYERYGKHLPAAGVGIEDSGHEDTYLLFTKLAPQGGNLYGIASINVTAAGSVEWGNIFVIFDNALKDDHTVAHEAGHSFSLPHAFETHALVASSHVFHKSYTENYMDYTSHISFDPATMSMTYVDPGTGLTYYHTRDNPYKGKMYSFFKWQWDIIRGDRSMKY